ncbi:G1/S-specific cyclin-D3-like isoform X1 [Amphibalanus amphitrite]|uniref:G1/S-specific cyclin-D3-like n=1 Tax=Amphibalanus amphitrite TaxID=1232801 RepID=UPI001C90FB67|nr:G1/S-specific cyclin-D3-like [Amphibalanus amphitrite]XP_043230408.1 G1/S-specific cyclin-D3-like isoform X1 [Amphibalanus amphitrite]
MSACSISRDLGDSLLCCESGVFEQEPICKAIRDPALINDRRVLTNLLDAESRYMASCSYFKCVQNEIKLPMRRILAYWMVEVCEEQRCQDDVFPLAMNLLDRFLSVTNVKKDHLQLLGAVCLFVASKLRETRPLTAEILVQCADNSISVPDIIDWELLVLHRLRWEINAVTSHDFLDPLLHRLSLERYLSSSRVPDVRRQAQTFIVMCSTEFKFSIHTPSMVAAASLAAAVQGLLPASREGAMNGIFSQLHRITAVETDLLRGCLDQIEEMIREFTAEQNSRAAAAPGSDPAADLSGEYQTAETPTDVREVHF